MDKLLNGPMGKVLKDLYPEQFAAIQKEDSWAVLTGEVENDADLKYIHNWGDCEQLVNL